jgi:hypothetical protein
MKKPVDEAFAVLLKDLERVAATYDNDAELGKRQALFAVLTFVFDATDNRRLARPLEHLCCDLEPRDRNNPTTAQLFQSALCLAAVEALVRSGETETVKAAIGAVSDASGHSVSDAYLESLRKNLKKRGNASVRELYDLLVACVPGELDGEKARRQARGLLGLVSALFAGRLTVLQLLHALNGALGVRVF